jgi:enolase
MNATDIRSIRARRVWDSRGRPTVEAELTLADGVRRRAIAPAGAFEGHARGARAARRPPRAAMAASTCCRRSAHVAEICCAPLVGVSARDQGALRPAA